MSAVNKRERVAESALDQFDSAVRPLFDRQLSQMGFSEGQIEQQDLAQLEMSLEKINNAIDNSGALMKFRVSLTAESGAIIAKGPDYHYEMSILPLLLARKGRILERIRALRTEPGNFVSDGSPAGASEFYGDPSGSQEIHADRDVFGAGRDFTINNYFGSGHEVSSQPEDVAADIAVGRFDADKYTSVDPQSVDRTSLAVGLEDRTPVTGRAGQKKAQASEVSIDAGIAYCRVAAQTGHPPHTVTNGKPDPDQPLDYLLAKTAEVVWGAVSAAQSELEPYLVPVRNYMSALIAKTGATPARDFALGILTERVRQEEDGWPDQPGDPGGKRSAHGTGISHLCLLERKHQVENAIYDIPGA